ncbi:hypothetical protein B0T25DRAFT_25157 [Lasiosphaeria hispida]|uniref:Uncharacterized protein n=1 Tax=Lasiosphaeria hispida TaxID=260671 RepID=A0AAJ0MJN3_9PEZI|nr:hypothetical protein B0T25DRAFT_25157 [Lasiosphaeria hispida]
MRSAVVLDDLGAASLATSRYEDGSSCSWHFAPFPCGQVQPIFISTNDDPKEKAWGMKWDELNNCLFDHVAFQKQTSPAIVTHMAHDLLCLDKIIHQHGDMALRYCAGGKGGAYISFPKPLNGAFSAHILLPTTGISGQICHPSQVEFQARGARGAASYRNVSLDFLATRGRLERKVTEREVAGFVGGRGLEEPSHLSFHRARPHPGVSSHLSPVTNSSGDDTMGWDGCRTLSGSRQVGENITKRPGAYQLLGLGDCRNSMRACVLRCRHQCSAKLEMLTKVVEPRSPPRSTH